MSRWKAACPDHDFRHAHLTLNSARQGYGVALANRMLLGDDLETGKLVPFSALPGSFKPVAFGAYTFLARARIAGMYCDCALPPLVATPVTADPQTGPETKSGAS